jgi:hypothetical protein
MSSRRAEKEAMKVIREKHERKYDAPLGKRRCRYEMSEKCLGIAAEYNKKGVLQWSGHKCSNCVLHRHRTWYAKHVEGREPKKRGRKPLSESEKKKRERAASKRKKSSTQKKNS